MILIVTAVAPCSKRWAALLSISQRRDYEALSPDTVAGFVALFLPFCCSKGQHRPANCGIASLNVNY
jgi:hypothetical protein